MHFFEKRPLMIKFSKFCAKSFHRYTNRRVVLKSREIWPMKNHWNRAMLTWHKKKNKILPGSPAVTTAKIKPKICQSQLPTMCSECSRFHKNRFTFGGVTAERVNTAKTCCKVNPIFGWSLASSWINIQICTSLGLQSSDKLQTNSLCPTSIFRPIHKSADYNTYIDDTTFC